MKDIAIVGAGGFGKETMLLVDHINQFRMQWNIIGYFDDGKKPGNKEGRYEILGGLDQLNRWQQSLNVVIAIADPKVKLNVISRLNNPNISFPTLIHPSCIHGEFQNLGAGAIVAANSSLTTNITIGRFVIINLSCTIGHDVTIDDYCSIMPGCNISGKVSIKGFTYVGTGAQILPGVHIGENVTIGAGAVVVKDVPSHQVVAGVPAKLIR